MFRKPKKKEEKKVRQRLADEDDEPIAQNDEDATTAAAKPPALLSFDHDEGADADFTLKKTNTKRVKELKRLAKLEDDADEQFEREQEELRRQEEEQEARRKERNQRDQYLDKYRNENDREAKVMFSDGDDVEIVEDYGHDDHDDVKNKFSSSFAGIPDSRAIYEAKKRRERMKNGGFIPLEEEGKKRRDEDSDESGGEEGGRFYSSKELLRNEEDRRREEQNEFLEQEQGDDVRDPEMDEWEKQQILKAVSRHTIGQIRTEFDESRRKVTAMAAQVSTYTHLSGDVDMEIDMDVETVLTKAPSGPATTGGVITIEDILAKLKLRIGDREEALNTRRAEIDKMEKTLDENRNSIQKIEMDAPEMAQKYAMYQEMRSYVRCLLDCLNEKVAEIDSIADRRRLMAKGRIERLLRRRQQDIKDQYAECFAAAMGKPPSRGGDAGVRAAEREARRARRRRQRESSLAGISHEEGLSSDDEESTSQQIVDEETIKESNVALEQIFVDADEDYSTLRRVLERIVDWYALDGKTFEEAWVHLCIPKLSSPYVRIEMIKADILNNANFTLAANQWYCDALLAGADRTDLDRESHIVVGIIPAIVEKVVIPFIVDVINDEWDPMSLRQCSNLGRLLAELSVYPTLTEGCKSLRTLVEAFKTKVIQSIDLDLFIPTMFTKQAIENPNTGCKSFLERQFWSAIKLIRCINKFSGFISVEMRRELIVDNIVNKVGVPGIQLGSTNDAACERKIRALMDELTGEIIQAAGGANSFRSLANCLAKVAEDMRAAGRDFSKDLRRLADQLAKS